MQGRIILRGPKIKGRFRFQSLCPREKIDFNLVKNQSRAGTPRRLNVVQLLRMSARTKADRKRSDWTVRAKIEKCAR